jgi:hypothetical protein
MQTLHRSSSRLSSSWILTLSRYGLGSGSRFHCNADPDPAYQNNVNLAPQLWFKRRPVRLTLEVLEMKQYSGFVTFWYGSGSDVLYHISGSGTVRWKNCCFKDWIWVEGCSVADPNPDLDPSVPFVFWASYIRIRIHQLVVLIKIRNRINIGIRILITSSKNKKKTINSYWFVIFFYIFFLKNYLNVH